MNKSTIGAVLLFAMAGCQQQDKAQPIENCWSKDTKATMQRLIEESSTEFLFESVKKAGKEKLTDDQKAFIKSRTKIALDNFHVLNNHREAGRLTCGVSVAFSFTRENDSALRAKMISEFDISQGESGLVYSFNKIPINLMIDSAKAGD